MTSEQDAPLTNDIDEAELSELEKTVAELKDDWEDLKNTPRALFHRHPYSWYIKKSRAAESEKAKESEKE